jgi:hypothetical protein
MTSTHTVYAPRCIKRCRRTKAQIRQLDDQIMEALRDCHPQSVRHVFYLMTNTRLPEVVEKSDRGTEQVKRRMIKLRRSGRLPYGWVEDMSRRGYHVATYDDAANFIRETRGLYRGDAWRDTPYYVEVWCESRSIAGVIMNLCEELGVSLYPAGGNTSISFAYRAAQNINDCHGGRRVVIFYVGDYDPAGVIIDKKIEEELRLHLDADVDMTFSRVAITPEQIRQYDLPTKPRKKTDKRSPEVKRTVEAEAMPPAILIRLLRHKIESLLPRGLLETMREIEEQEQEVLLQLADALDRQSGA